MAADQRHRAGEELTYPMATTTTILLADDHAVVRQGLRGLLESEPDFEIVAETADGLATVEAVQRLMPDVVVLDLTMPSLPGLEVIGLIKKHSPEIKVVVLSMHADESYVIRALNNGATAYVLKCANLSELIHAIREAIAGRCYLSPPLSDYAIRTYQESAKATILDKYETLTARERQVLQLVAEGHANVEVAAKLGISPRTAETHRFNLMNKLGFKNQADLIAFAFRHGLIPKD